MPVLNDLGRDYGKKGLVVLAINVDGDRDKYQKFVKASGYSYLQWGRDATGEIARSYRVRGVPTTYVLNHEGVIHSVHVGYGGGIGDVLRQEVKALLDELP